EYMDLGYETDWHKFLKLDSMDRPGLMEVEFFSLFASVRCACSSRCAKHSIATTAACKGSMIQS
ncbi:hypothetical protein L208DRAFT_1295668, partial [Tricholoma matsutake]